jgi:putative phosphoribosyl transferase
MTGCFRGRVAQAAANKPQELRRRDCIYQRQSPDPRCAALYSRLVDDGIATGSALLATIATWRQQQSKRIAIAPPAASISSCDALKAELTQWCIISAEPLYSISFWYQYFSQTIDEEVCNLLERATDKQMVTSP